MTTGARYDPHAAWYDVKLPPFAQRADPLLRKWLGPGSGRCLDIGCGGGVQLAVIRELGWAAVGLDLSRNQLRVAEERRAAKLLVQADAAVVPFADASFDAVVAGFVHTDVDDWSGVVAEVGRVLRPGGRFISVCTHPCFVGPFSAYAAPLPRLHPGYRRTERVFDGPGIGRGLRRRVGAVHVPLADLLQAVIDAGLRLDRVEEPGPEDYPRVLAFAATRDGAA